MKNFTFKRSVLLACMLCSVCNNFNVHAQRHSKEILTQKVDTATQVLTDEKNKPKEAVIRHNRIMGTDEVPPQGVFDNLNRQIKEKERQKAQERQKAMIKAINDAKSNKNYAQLYSVLNDNKNTLRGSTNNPETLQTLQELQVYLNGQFGAQNDLLTEVNELKTLRNNLTPNNYSEYTKKANALQTKDKELVIKKNGILEINTSVADILKQDVGNLDKALEVLDDICKGGICRTQ